MKSLEHAEHPACRGLRDADARVGHLEAQIAILHERAQRDVAAARGEFHGIRNEVEEHLANASRIDEK